MAIKKPVTAKRPGGMKKSAWIIPVNTAILFGVLCYWAIQQHDTPWAVISILLCLLNAFFAFRWFQMQRTRK